MYSKAPPLHAFVLHVQQFIPEMHHRHIKFIARSDFEFAALWITVYIAKFLIIANAAVMVFLTFVHLIPQYGPSVNAKEQIINLIVWPYLSINHHLSD